MGSSGRPRIEKWFPNLRSAAYDITSPDSPVYNCVAWAAGDDSAWWEPTDPSQPGYAHCDCQFDRPTVRVGDTVVSQDGRLALLDDPQIREVAAEYGPPEVVLDDNPQLILPRRYCGAP